MRMEKSYNKILKQRKESAFLCPDCGEGLYGARKRYGLKCKNPDCDVHTVRYNKSNEIIQIWRSTIPVSLTT